MSDYSDYQVISPTEDPSDNKWAAYYLSPTKQKVHIKQSMDQKAGGSDIDYYKFTASSDKTITLTFDDTGKTFGVLSLVSASDLGNYYTNLLTYGEHGSKQQAEQYNYKYSFSYNVKAGQTYYIAVNHIQTYNSLHNSGLGNYSIYIDFNGAIDTTATAPQPSSAQSNLGIVGIDSDNAPNGESEPGKPSLFDWGTEFDLKPYYKAQQTTGYTVIGTLSDTDKWDAYKFSVDSNMKVNILFDFDFGSSDNDQKTMSIWFYQGGLYYTNAVAFKNAQGYYEIKDIALDANADYGFLITNLGYNNVKYTAKINFLEAKPIIEIDSDNPPNGEDEPGARGGKTGDAHHAFYLDPYYVKEKTEGYKIKGTLGAADLLDKYRFSVDKDMKASILFDSVGGDNVTVRLHKVNTWPTTVLVATATRNANGDYEIKNALLTANTTYIVEIDNVGKGDVTYDLNINFGEPKIVEIDSDNPANGEAEPEGKLPLPGKDDGATFDLRPYYTNGKTEGYKITGTFDKSDKTDIYKFSVHENMKVNIMFDGGFTVDDIKTILPWLFEENLWGGKATGTQDANGRYFIKDIALEAGLVYYVSLHNGRKLDNIKYTLNIDFAEPEPIVVIDSDNAPNGELEPGGTAGSRFHSMYLTDYYVKGKTEGFKIKGTMSNSDKMDNYRFSVEKNIKGNILFDSVDGNNMRIELRKVGDDDPNTVLVQKAVRKANGDYTIKSVDLEKDADYVLEIETLGKEDVTYDLNINFGAPKIVEIDSDNPPNGEAEPEGHIPLNPENGDGATFDLRPYYTNGRTEGYKIKGTFDKADKADIYKFSVDENIKVNIMFDGGFKVDDIIKIGPSLFEDHIFGDGAVGIQDANGQYFIKDFALEKGHVYYIALENTRKLDNINYTLNIDFAEPKPITEIDSDTPPNGEPEPGSGHGAYRAFYLDNYYVKGKTEGYKIKGTLDATDLLDKYRFSVEKNMKTSILFDSVGGDTVTVKLHKASGGSTVLVATATRNANGDYEIKNTQLTANVYYIVEIDNAGKGDVTYDLNINFDESKIVEINSDNPPNGEAEPGSAVPLSPGGKQSAFDLQPYYANGKTEGYKLTGTLSSTDKFDTYKFAVDKNMKGNIVFDADFGDADEKPINVLLFKDHVLDLIATATQDANGNYIIKNIALETGHNYYVSIDNRAKVDGVKYTMDIDFAEPKPIVEINSDNALGESEPGETTATAFDLESYYTKGTTDKLEIMGTMSANDRNDYYRLSFKTDTKAKIELTNINHGGDIDLAMYDANMNTLFYEWEWGNADLHIDAYNFKAGKVYYVRTYDYLGVDSSYTLLVDIL